MPRRKQTEGEKKIDISQMAEDLGVSKTTVSRALSGNGRVSEATRARVVQYAKEKNYVPNMLARGLVTQQSYNISLVFSRQFGNLAAPFLRKTVSAVYDIATRNDYDVLMTMVGEQETSPMQRLLINRKIDGVILARTLERDPLIPMLQKSGIPFVAIGRPADQDVISVDHDQVGGCRELVSLLLMKGLHRIALLGGSMLYTVNQSRLEGYKQAHDRACCKIDESLLFLELESDDLRTSAVELAVQRGADCILCMDDQVAQLALNTLRQLNLRVPQDISVSGYDGIALGRYSNPRLTTIRQNSERLAQRGAEILLNCIENGSSAVHEVVPFELIEDESVAALPNH